MSAKATVDEIELGVKDDDGEIQPVYAKLENVVTVRQILRKPKKHSFLLYVPGGAATLSLILFGKWLLALPVAIVALFLGYYGAQSPMFLLKTDLWDADPTDPNHGLNESPVVVTTQSDTQRADEFDVEDFEYRLTANDIDHQRYAGEFSTKFHDTMYEYYILEENVGEVDVTRGDSWPVNYLFFGAAILTGIGLFLLSNDLITASVPAVLLASGGVYFDTQDQPAYVEVRPSNEDALEVDDSTAHRRLVVPDEDASQIAEALTSGEKRELASEGEIQRESTSQFVEETEYSQPADFEEDLDTLLAGLESDDPFENMEAGMNLAAGAQKYPDLAVDAVDSVIHSLDHDTKEVRHGCVMVLGAVSDASASELTDLTIEQAIKGLLDGLADDDEEIQRDASLGLAGWAASHPEQMKPHLIEALAADHVPIPVGGDPQDIGIFAALSPTIEKYRDHEELRNGLHSLIEALAKESPVEASHQIGTYLSETDPHPAVLGMGLTILGSLAADYPTQVELPENIADYLAEDSTRLLALIPITNIAQESPERIEHLASNITAIFESRGVEHEDPSDTVTEAALGILVPLAQRDPDLVREPQDWLPDCLAHVSVEVRYRACELLAELGEAAVPADYDIERVLRKRLTDESEEVRSAACHAVGTLQLSSLKPEIIDCRDDGIEGADQALEAIE